MTKKISRLVYLAFSTLVVLSVSLALSNVSRAQQQNNQTAPTPTPTPKKKSGDGKEIEIVNTDLVSLTITVFDQYGRSVTGLTKNAFSVFDNDEKQDIVYFNDDDAPVSVGVIFDLSGSMNGDKVKRAREALKKFVETSHEEDEYFLIGFNSRAQLLLDKTRDGDALLSKLTFVETKGTTALYDACYLGVEKVLRGAHQKRALLIISDGQDNNSRYTFSELRRLLKESDVTVYGVGILGGGDLGSSLGMQGQSFLEEMAGVTGGKTFFPSSAGEMDDAFFRIATELRHQYSIGYTPSNFTNNGKWHKVKVKVQPPRGLPKLNVRTKEGYYAIVNPR